MYNDIIEAAKKVVDSMGHELTCDLLRPPNGVSCTCGAIEDQKVLRAGFLKMYNHMKMVGTI